MASAHPSIHGGSRLRLFKSSGGEIEAYVESSSSYLPFESRPHNYTPTGLQLSLLWSTLCDDGCRIYWNREHSEERAVFFVGDIPGGDCAVTLHTPRQSREAHSIPWNVPSELELHSDPNGIAAFRLYPGQKIELRFLSRGQMAYKELFEFKVIYRGSSRVSQSAFRSTAPVGDPGYIQFGAGSYADQHREMREAHYANGLRSPPTADPSNAPVQFIDPRYAGLP